MDIANSPEKNSILWSDFVRFSVKGLISVIVVSSILFILTLAYPTIMSFVISSITGVAVDKNAASIAIISSADGPTAVFYSYAGLPIYRYCLLGVCVIAIAFSAIKIRKISKAAK